MSNPSTVYTSSEKLAGPLRSAGVSEGVQLVGGKESNPATSSSKQQGEEETGFDSLQFDEDSLSFEVSVSVLILA